MVGLRVMSVLLTVVALLKIVGVLNIVGLINVVGVRNVFGVRKVVLREAIELKYVVGLQNVPGLYISSSSSSSSFSPSSSLNISTVGLRSLTLLIGRDCSIWHLSCLWFLMCTFLHTDMHGTVVTNTLPPGIGGSFASYWKKKDI